ncbi:RDD family protein [Schlesneria paludicola]|uniref:RDD family protein n=1 Tax=Schlesneria paludicola TaxID=360056 RepID=UPI00029AE10F|nr:RDD family protein [Schlesneria paludicola]
MPLGDTSLLGKTSDSAAFARSGYAMSLIVLLSILLPVGIAVISIHTAISGKPFGFPTHESKIYQGPLIGSELWFTVAKLTGNPALPSSVHSRIKRLDLETGIERETGFEVDGDGVFPVRLNEEIYGVSHTAIYRFGAQPMEKILRPARAPGYFPVPFLYEGRLTDIAETNRGGFRLVHWTGDHWVDGRAILLPDFDRVWWHDPQRERRVLLPRSSEKPAVGAGTGRLRIILVQPCEQEFHLFLTDYAKFAAYRKGFEFADQTEENLASGLTPENAAPEVSGWEPIYPDKPDTRWVSMERNDESLMFISFTHPPTIARRTSDGHWGEIKPTRPDNQFAKADNWHSVLLSDPVCPTSYLIEEDQLWGAAVVHRIHGNGIQAVHLTLPGGRPAYLKRWQFLCLGILIAWLTHLVVVVVGFDWATRRLKRSHYQFGMQQAMLASILRRAMALMIDGLLMMSLILPLVYADVCTYGPDWKSLSEKQLCNQLFELERSIDQGMKNGALSPTSINLQSWGSLLLRLTSDRGTLILFAAVLLILCTVRPLVRSWFGMTVGEWLAGIRRMRTTLRPVEFPRALLCEALYCLDIPGLMTPLPGAICMFVSPNRQRIGDRVADTLVVDAGSIREANEDVTPSLQD